MRNTLWYSAENNRRLGGKLGRGRPRRARVDDLRYWAAGSKRYDQMKRAAERRDLHGTFATLSSGRNNE